LSSGSRRTDSTEAGAEPIGWTTTSAPTPDLFDVVAALGLVGHRLGHAVGRHGS
jgi:hypothetical protein